MPDAHMDFDLPIGGVLATDNAVIPYAVSMDIGCRMALSIIDESYTFLKRYEYQNKQAMNNHTHFGMEGGLEVKQAKQQNIHIEVLENKAEIFNGTLLSAIMMVTGDNLLSGLHVTAMDTRLQLEK
ncbi:RtcB family protein [Mucilaginibacter sp. CSA2-8R]|uniref:RtcB family protein n=1 Tax=Mucilaginibacter sp. CSA2-8R TaxID=3141542 RepID=UPI00315D8665